MDQLKRQAAARALDEVRDGMQLGLGTGSTAKHFVELLGERVRSGLKVIGVPTSEATRADAIRCGVPLTTLDEIDHLDLTVDGADEVDPELNLIKGGGGAIPGVVEHGLFIGLASSAVLAGGGGIRVVERRRPKGD